MAEQKHLGRIKLQPGQSLFCLNMKTGEITDMGRPRHIYAARIAKEMADIIFGQ